MSGLAKITYTDESIEVVEFNDSYTLFCYTNHDHVLDVDIWDIRNGKCSWVADKRI